MKKWGTRCLRPTSMLAMAALILILPACGGSSGGGGGGGTVPGAPTANFTSNDAGTSTDLVRFGTSACVANMCTVDIFIGATTESDYFAFAFDIVISDTTVARFVSGSDIAGPFLQGTVDSVVAQIGDRVVIGVSKSGAVLGNGTGTEDTVVSLDFELLKVGDALLIFDGSPSNPNLANCSAMGPEAIDSAGNCTVNTIFGAGGLLTGS